MGSLKDALLGDRPYPHSPGFRARGTSRAAAGSMKATASALRSQVLNQIVLAGDAGLTADEAADLVGADKLAIRPRVTELGATEPPLIRDSGRRRKNDSGRDAIVWVKAGD